LDRKIWFNTAFCIYKKTITMPQPETAQETIQRAERSIEELCTNAFISTHRADIAELIRDLVPGITEAEITSKIEKFKQSCAETDAK